MSDPAPTAGACPACGAPVADGDDFCEACGANLRGGPDAAPPAAQVASTSSLPATVHTGGLPATVHTGGLPATVHTGGLPATAPSPPPVDTRPCVACGAPPDEIGADRYCGRCGLRQPDPRDHQEIDLGIAAGVTDKGRHHHRNEDAMRIAVLPGDSVVAVVCDGVSSSISPEIASRAAADAAAGTFIDAGTAATARLSESVVQAVAAAQAAVLDVAWTPDGSLAAPACTFVSATTYRGSISVGWVGDSRAYWVGATGVRRLTSDDSWAQEQTTAGLMTEQQAEGDTRSHAITRWLGSDAPEDGPQVATFVPGEPGRLVVCSDGLWNYLTAPEQLAELMDAEPAKSSPLAAAQTLTRFALDAGGHDNITVVVADVAPPPTSEGAA